MELVEKQKASERKREIRRLEERLSEEIPGFAEKYVFACGEQAVKLGGFACELHLKLAAKGGISNFDHRRAYVPDGNNDRRVWMEFFLGNREIYKAYVGGRAADFIADFDDWWDLDPFDVLLFDDLSGFLFFERSRHITEIMT